MKEYNAKFKMRKEETEIPKEKVELVLSTWSTTDKAFRLIKRWSFVDGTNPADSALQFDLSMVRSSARDKQGQYHMVKTFNEMPFTRSLPTYEIEVELIMMSVPDVPTVKPDTIVVPALLRNSARAAVPVPLAVALNGTPERVRTPLETVPGVAERVTDARTPVAPESADVPITSVPAKAVPVEAAAVFDAIRSATSCIRLLFKVVVYTTAIFCSS
jgi:hypothetical protein